MSKDVTLSEIFGRNLAQKDSFEMSDLREMLGEKMPDLPFNSVGKLRLINSLRERFGDGFRNIPRIKKLISNFDDRVKEELDLIRVKKMKL